MKKIRHARVQSCALFGIDGLPVEIEACILPGLPSFDIVGLGHSAIRESRNRILAAIRNSGYTFPSGRVIVSHAPAWLRKEGSAFDLPAALAILAASDQMALPEYSFVAFAELTLDGSLRSPPGAFCRAAALRAAHIAPLLVARDDLADIRAASIQSVHVCDNLRQAVTWLSGNPILEAWKEPALEPLEPDRQTAPAGCVDLASIIGQDTAIRALLIAAAGRHNLLMLGAPGCGKTTLASILPALLPPLSSEEAIETARIASARGYFDARRGLPQVRPFRNPHHNSSIVAMLGGGSNPLPGEVSLAHNGVLFLDEMTEFQPRLLDQLRQPIEQGFVRILRWNRDFCWPADFQLIGAANPCRCGLYFEPGQVCRCGTAGALRHLSRISGPMMDRIDMVVELNRVPAHLLSAPLRVIPGRSTREAAEAVTRCWQRQQERQDAAGGAYWNGRIQGNPLETQLRFNMAAIKMAQRCGEKHGLSVRGFWKLLRVARTIADLESEDVVGVDHVAEAAQFRLMIQEQT